jgi:RHS repeat-associated protein
VTTETIDVGPTSHPTWYYDASGKRVVEIETLANGNKPWTLYLYDISGHISATLTGDSYNINVPTRNAYFGNRLIQSNGAWVVTDRLGSVRANSNGETFSYLPYGEERTPTANARIKFGTYTRDSTTYNQDYADQRYYNPWFGRFNSPDPSVGSNTADPASWNKYVYTRGDPVNRIDPQGTDDCLTFGFEGGLVDIPCGAPPNLGDMGFPGGFPTIPACGDLQPDQFNPGIGMACLYLLQLFQSLQAAPPPLTCDYTGANITPAGFYNVQGPDGAAAIAFVNPVTLNYNATGGTGQYQWSVTQTVSLTGSITYSNGYIYQEPNGTANDNVFPGELSTRGSTLSFSDTPGIGNSPGASIVSANITWNFKTTVSVTSGGQTVQCPQIAWTTNVNWKTVRGRPVVRGSARVVKVGTR